MPQRILLGTIGRVDLPKAALIETNFAQPTFGIFLCARMCDMSGGVTTYALCVAHPRHHRYVNANPRS